MTGDGRPRVTAVPECTHPLFGASDISGRRTEVIAVEHRTLRIALIRPDRLPSGITHLGPGIVGPADRVDAELALAAAHALEADVKHAIGAFRDHAVSHYVVGADADRLRV